MCRHGLVTQIIHSSTGNFLHGFSVKKRKKILIPGLGLFFPDAVCIFAYFVKIRHSITTQQASASQFNYNNHLGPFKVLWAFVTVGLYKNACETNW